jgi:hypothetical protein
MQITVASVVWKIGGGHPSSCIERKIVGMPCLPGTGGCRVTMIQGVMFIIRVLAFRRGIIGEVGASFRLAL